MTGDLAVCQEGLDITQSRKYGVVDWIDSDVLATKLDSWKCALQLDDSV